MQQHTQQTIAPSSELPAYCPYCGRPTERVRAEALFKRDFGELLACSGFDKGCRTYAVIHPKTGRLDGRLADEELRQLRSALSDAVRPLWANADRYHRIKEQGKWRKDAIEKFRQQAKHNAYEYLARQLNLKRLWIKDLSKAQCRFAIEVAKRTHYRDLPQSRKKL